MDPGNKLTPYICYEGNYIIMWKVTTIISLIIGIIGALVWLVDLASKKNLSTKEILALTLDIAYFPSAIVLILWVLGLI